MASSSLRVRMGAWYGDEEAVFDVPPRWHVDAIVPRTPPPLRDEDIHTAIANPVGQPPLRVRALGKRRPLILVDDLTRPTPTDVIVPHVLDELARAGIAAAEVTILVACGAHGRTARDAAIKKAGAAGRACRLLIHDARGTSVDMGRTSFGTRVLVDPAVAASDLVIGIGGVYPQHSVGFGGGSKLILGALAHRSIVGLHYGHTSVAGSYDIDNDFRRDLDEMARIARLETVVSVHVDASRRPVRIVAGDPASFYVEAARVSMDWYAAPASGDGYDVVIANAYPMDVSLTFARSKGLAPLAHAGPEASRVLIAACPEGLGLHRLFPYLNGPWFEAQIHQLRRWSVVRPSTVPRRVLQKARSAARRVGPHVSQRAGTTPRQHFAGELPAASHHGVHLFAPMSPAGALPSDVPGMRRASTWKEIVDRVEAEQGRAGDLRVAYYTCSPLQCVTREASRAAVAVSTW